MGGCKSVFRRRERHPPPAPPADPPAPTAEQHLGSQPPPPTPTPAPAPVITPYRPFTDAGPPAPAPAAIPAFASPLRIEPIGQSRVVYECNNPVPQLAHAPIPSPAPAPVDRPGGPANPTTSPRPSAFLYPHPTADAGFPAIQIEPYDLPEPEEPAIPAAAPQPAQSRPKPKSGAGSPPRPPLRSPTAPRARSPPPTPPPRRSQSKPAYYPQRRPGSPLHDVDYRASPPYESRYAESRESPRRSREVDIAALREEVTALLEDDLPHRWSPRKSQWRSPYGPFPQRRASQPDADAPPRSPPRAVLPDGRALALLSDAHPPAYRNSGRGGLPFPQYSPAGSRNRTTTPVDFDPELPVVVMSHPRVPVSSAGYTGEFGSSSVTRYSGVAPLPTLPPAPILPPGGYPIAPQVPVTVTEYVATPVTTYVVPPAPLFGSPTQLHATPSESGSHSRTRVPTPSPAASPAPQPAMATTTTTTTTYPAPSSAAHPSTSTTYPAYPTTTIYPAASPSAYSATTPPAPQGASNAAMWTSQELFPIGPFNALEYRGQADSSPLRVAMERNAAVSSAPNSLTRSNRSLSTDHIPVDMIVKEYRPRSGHSAVIDAVEYPPEPRLQSPAKGGAPGRKGGQKRTPRPKRKTEVW